MADFVPVSSGAVPRPLPSPLLLLLHVNGLTLWRRLKAVGRQSRLLTSLIAAFITGYLALAYWLFVEGLRFVARFPGLGTVLTERLMFLLFAFLFALLLISNLIISYSNLFRNRETSFLLSLPLSSNTVFQWKFIESTMLASWAFVFLIAPLLAAYGLTRNVPWHFYVATFVLVGMFIVLPAVAGSFCAVNLARYLDRRLFQVLAVYCVLMLLSTAALWLKPEPVLPESVDGRVQVVFDKLLTRTRFAEFPLLPSCWLSRSVVHWAEGALWSAGFFVLVLLSYVAFFGMLAFTRLGRPFHDATSVVQSRASVFARWGWFRARQHRHHDAGFAIGPMERAVSWVPLLAPDVRAVVAKDLRMFWRDTSQWAQSLMLFGLLAAYIFNLRHFSQQLGNPFWTHLVSFLNLGACALNLATLTTRFVYPQFSLEGKRLWIVGMAPLGLVRIVTIKYWLASVTSLCVTLGLITLSCHMLQMSLARTFFFGAVVAIMTLTLSGLAVGLGALYPNFKEENPSKIVSGFGGTFCLVLSFLYILGSVVLLALATPWDRPETGSPLRVGLCLGAFALISLGLGCIPLRLGLRQVGRFEL